MNTVGVFLISLFSDGQLVLFCAQTYSGGEMILVTIYKPILGVDDIGDDLQTYSGGR